MATNNDKGQSPGLGRLDLVWTLLPQIPLVIKIILLHILGRSESAKYLDLRSDLIISVVRSIFDGKPRPVSVTQAMTLRDPGVKGRLWVSAVASKVPPEQGIRDALLAAISSLGNPEEEAKRNAEPSFRIPDIVPVEAEWTGHRAAATRDSLPPAISEEAKYGELMKEVTNKTTILYFHGGAYYLCDPATHRSLTKHLARLTGGRVYSVRYRLAPQNPFPAALLDALVSYFTLLYPPPGAVHEAVAPENIVFSGDSAGGNLCVALLQTLLELRRQGRKVAWFGVDREVVLPAALALSSPWVDLTQSMPSWERNQRWCYLASPRLLAEEKEEGGHRKQQRPPPDDIWPANPPRRHLYADDAYLLHPLASLQMCGPGAWEGSPPVYVSCGWECIADEIKYLASRMARDGVTVVFEEYEAMPHVFSSILPRRPEAKRCLDRWGAFMRAVAGGGGEGEGEGEIKSSWKTIKAKTLEEVDIDVDTLTPFTEEDVRRLALLKVLGREKKKKMPLVDVPAKL
ncbi:Alpha/Beta hydrolase protein [Hypoxylon fragiforme]|uniref:Alpha/Beta hydrolase protein n=1 Tax=Hypoxylon fragiforme TaxID=63214 RepID=UPI0020C6E35A|nr:Alpha/Beta hydrolase protein [Hypoxylon fragiforme]KAI2610156.1 Alpha/Beta hydrolase protein [Hypoxylon fragiforme]